jgi:hypothetical protein
MRNVLLHGTFRRSVQLAAVVLLVWRVALVMADPLDNWSWRLPAPQSGVDFSTVAYGNGVFIVDGPGNHLMFSTDGESWLPIETPNRSRILRVTFGNGRFVAVGGAGVILTSENGVDWTPRNSGTNATLWALAFGNGRFVAAGNGFTLISTDGLAWTLNKAFPDSFPNSMVFGNGVFVSVLGSSSIASSSDGIHWSPPVYIGFLSGRITFGNGRFVVLDGVSSGRLYVSENGVNWGSHPQPNQSSSEQIIFGNGAFLLLGLGRIYASPDAVNWALVAQGPNYTSISSMGFAGGTYFFASARGSRTSRDGLNWKLIGPETPRVRHVIWTGEGFVTFGNTTATSVDAARWELGTDATPGTAGMNRSVSPVGGMASGNGLHLVSDLNVFYSSTNGLDWTQLAHTGLQRSVGLTFGHGWFLTHDPVDYTVKRSTNGLGAGHRALQQHSLGSGVRQWPFYRDQQQRNGFCFRGCDSMVHQFRRNDESYHRDQFRQRSIHSAGRSAEPILLRSSPVNRRLGLGASSCRCGVGLQCTQRHRVQWLLSRPE